MNADVNRFGFGTLEVDEVLEEFLREYAALCQELIVCLKCIQCLVQRTWYAADFLLFGVGQFVNVLSNGP